MRHVPVRRDADAYREHVEGVIEGGMTSGKLALDLVALEVPLQERPAVQPLQELKHLPEGAANVHGSTVCMRLQ